MALACLGFLFLLLGQDGLHHIARLRDVGQVNLWCNCLRSARRRSAAGVARPTRSMLEVCANFVSFMFLDRTRMSLPLTHAEFREYIKNLATLDFHFAREIVNSNLAHPPLFRMCCPSP